MHDFDYELRVFWSEMDSCYLAEVPELPGCVADGTTPEEAVTNARDRIREWVVFARELGRDVPTARPRPLFRSRDTPPAGVLAAS